MNPVIDASGHVWIHLGVFLFVLASEQERPVMTDPADYKLSTIYCVTGIDKRAEGDELPDRRVRII
jgi:hypothetical protein